MGVLRSYAALTKPRLLPLVLFSGVPALVMASGGWPSFDLAAVTLLGTGLAAGAANSLNSYLERELDARMERTRKRPLPAGVLKARNALIFGLALGLLGTGTLWTAVGATAALIALAAILLYVFVYTLWLKPRTPLAVVLGGLSGAVSPLIADAAIDGSIGSAGWILFGIIFAWQPPHFYAIALYRKRDYANAELPMLHDRIGEDATRRRIIAWILGLLPLTLLPVALSLLGPLYAMVALALGAWFLYHGVQLLRARSAESAKRLFRVSLIYLLGIFAAMILDLAVSAPS
jgi:protoheme IX farnesyltransferase